MSRGSPEANIDKLVKEADRIEPLDPQRAAVMKIGRLHCQHHDWERGHAPLGGAHASDPHVQLVHKLLRFLRQRSPTP